MIDWEVVEFSTVVNRACQDESQEHKDESTRKREKGCLSYMLHVLQLDMVIHVTP